MKSVQKITLLKKPYSAILVFIAIWFLFFSQAWAAGYGPAFVDTFARCHSCPGKLRPLAVGESKGRGGWPAPSGWPTFVTRQQQFQSYIDAVNQSTTREGLIDAVRVIVDSLKQIPSPSADFTYETNPEIEQGASLLLDLYIDPREGGGQVKKLAASYLTSIGWSPYWRYPRTLPGIFKKLYSVRKQAKDLRERGDQRSAARLEKMAEEFENLFIRGSADPPSSGVEQDYHSMIGFTSAVTFAEPEIGAGGALNLNVDLGEMTTVYGLPERMEDYYDLTTRAIAYLGHAAKRRNIYLVRISDNVESSDRARIMILLWKEFQDEKHAIENKYISTVNEPGNLERQTKEMQNLIVNYAKLTEMLLEGESRDNTGNFARLFYGDDPHLRLKAGHWLLWLAKFGNKRAAQALQAAAGDPVITDIRREWRRRNAELDREHEFTSRASLEDELLSSRVLEEADAEQAGLADSSI